MRAVCQFDTGYKQFKFFFTKAGQRSWSITQVKFSCLVGKSHHKEETCKV